MSVSNDGPADRPRGCARGPGCERTRADLVVRTLLAASQTLRIRRELPRTDPCRRTADQAAHGADAVLGRRDSAAFAALQVVQRGLDRPLAIDALVGERVEAELQALIGGALGGPPPPPGCAGPVGGPQ